MPPDSGLGNLASDLYGPQRPQVPSPYRGGSRRFSVGFTFPTGVNTSTTPLHSGSPTLNVGPEFRTALLPRSFIRRCYQGLVGPPSGIAGDPANVHPRRFTRSYFSDGLSRRDLSATSVYPHRSPRHRSPPQPSRLAIPWSLWATSSTLPSAHRLRLHLSVEDHRHAAQALSCKIGLSYPWAF